MWYAVHVVGGKEKAVLSLIRKTVNPALIDEIFVPQYETMKKIKGAWVKRREVLLPGYLIVVCDDPDAVQHAMNAVPAYARVLRTGDTYSALSDQEIAFLNAFVDSKSGDRTVAMSTGVIEGDEIVILSGPLFGKVGLITKIDRHKRIAYLDFPIMGRVKTVKVGLEIIRKH